MCGIIGVFNHPDHEKRAALALDILEPRGADNRSLRSDSSSSLGHVLHAIVGNKPQPLQNGKGTLVANCEIYNWQDLDSEKTASNDAELLLQLLDASDLSEQSVKDILASLDGVYACIYQRNKTVIFARDLIGVKPLWFAHQEGLALASEKKALIDAGYFDITDLNPRMIGSYNLESQKLQLWQRDFFKKSITDLTEEQIVEKAAKLVKEAIKKRIPSKDIKVGVLYSGGIDSTLIAKVLKDLGIDFTCYTAHVHNPNGQKAHDLEAAQATAKKYGFPLTVIDATQERIPTLAKTVTQEIEEAHAVKVAVGMPFYLCAQAAALDGCKVIFSGLGAEELFAGYQRHKESADINDECINGLLWMYERDLYRDDVLTMRQGVELRVPLLDHKLTEFALSIPGEQKIIDSIGKQPLRKASILLGLDSEDAFRPKRAAQYGSGFDKALQKEAKKHGQNRVQYLQQFTRGANRKLGILCSGGKDSWYAAQVMARQNYELTCLLVMKSENLESYMFHTPAVELVKQQSLASNIPLLEQSTVGEKETELIDLKTLLQRAKEKFHIDGIIVGALYSQYQRQRVETICNDLGLKPYAPLWHIGQASEVRELIKEGFEVVLTAIAGEGMSKKWLGRVLDEQALVELIALEKKIGFNAAGEGGEYESFVLDCPLFEKKLVIKGTPVMENELTGTFNISSCTLEEKQ